MNSEQKVNGGLVGAVQDLDESIQLLWFLSVSSQSFAVNLGLQHKFRDGKDDQ